MRLRGNRKPPPWSTFRNICEFQRYYNIDIETFWKQHSILYMSRTVSSQKSMLTHMCNALLSEGEEMSPVNRNKQIAHLFQGVHMYID